MTGHAGLMEKPAFSVPAKKMAMWLFIIADSATFAACLVAYGFLRNATPNWPRPFHSITNVAIMTFILVTSSLTMLFAIDAAKAGDKAKALRWTHDYRSCGRSLRLVAHPGMDGPDRRRHDPVQEPVGHRPVWRRILQHHRPAPAARYRRSDCAAWQSGSAIKAAVTTPTISKSPACTGTSWTWSGCSLCRWSTC